VSLTPIAIYHQRCRKFTAGVNTIKVGTLELRTFLRILERMPGEEDREETSSKQSRDTVPFNIRSLTWASSTGLWPFLPSVWISLLRKKEASADNLLFLPIQKNKLIKSTIFYI
jgi:hypothetical protein